jgi:hypothetical protein
MALLAFAWYMAFFVLGDLFGLTWAYTIAAAWIASAKVGEGA